jgi:uncharacterized membrane protein YfcA
MGIELSIVFYTLLFILAFLYASVGHGGASGYLALMAIFSMAPEVMRPTALVLNLFVSLTAFIQFYRAKHFDWKIFLPLAMASVPMAFVGGMIDIDPVMYKRILGFLLVIPILRFLFFPSLEVSRAGTPNVAVALLMGGSIGLLSGLIGIGGGIILSPLLLLLRWTDQKQTAAISALFIFVNSLSGLGGQWSRGIVFTADMGVYTIVALMGGLCGAYLGALKFNQRVLKILLAVVLLIASYKLIWTG